MLYIHNNIYIYIYTFISTFKINNPCRYTIHGCYAHSYLHIYTIYLPNNSSFDPDFCLRHQNTDQTTPIEQNVTIHLLVRLGCSSSLRRSSLYVNLVRHDGWLTTKSAEKKYSAGWLVTLYYMVVIVVGNPPRTNPRKIQVSYKYNYNDLT